MSDYRQGYINGYRFSKARYEFNEIRIWNELYEHWYRKYMLAMSGYKYMKPNESSEYLRGYVHGMQMAVMK